MAYFIRNATADDLAQIIRLGHESPTGAHWTNEHYQSLFTDTPSASPRVILVAIEQEGSIIGFLAARQVTLEWELENVVVATVSRGKGVGSSLLRELLARAESGGGQAVFLEVRESNIAARRLYEKLGFEQTGRRKGYYTNPPEDAVLYSKTLQTETISG